MQNIPRAMVAPWARLMTRITPQIKVRPMAATP